MGTVKINYAEWEIDQKVGADEPRREFMVVSRNSWGRGATVELAAKAYRKETGSWPKRKESRVLDVPEGAWIDGSGMNLSWKRQEG